MKFVEPSGEELVRIRVPASMFGGSGWYEVDPGEVSEDDAVHRDGRRVFVWRTLKEGPIRRSWYRQWPSSGNRGTDGPLGIIRPFTFDGRMFFTHGLVSGAGIEREAECSPIVPTEDFSGRIWESPTEKYHHNSDIDEFMGDYARSDPMGFFYGVRAQINKDASDWVVSGPERIFIEQPAGQLLLF